MDDRAGNVSQVQGVAEKLQMPFERIDIKYNSLAKLPNFLIGDSLLAYDKASKAAISSITSADIIISAGRRTVAAMLYLQKKTGAKIVQIMDPKYKRAEFDIIASLKHDNLKADNVIEISCSPHRISEDKLKKEAGYWKATLASKKKPYVFLSMGGDSKYGKISVSEAKSLAKKLSRLVKKMGGTLLVTTSRRTSVEVRNALMNNITCDNIFYAFREGIENPYLGYLALADYIVVSGDSVSMCSEALYAGKPLFVSLNLGSISKKHRRFLKGLFESSVAAPLEQNTGFLSDKSFTRRCEAINPTRIDTAKEIADEILLRFIDV